MHTDPSTPANDPDLSALGRELLETGSSKPSGPWVPPTAEELHKLLPEYDIVKMLGRGGMGAVYMGRQTSLDRPVAIKILSNTLDQADASFAERFKNEARALGKLNHPGIVGVYDFGTAPGGLLYIVMEYVDGTDVARMIAGQGRLHTDHAMAITAHVCDALAYAHERGIIHRDIKPANIMVGYDGEVKVADFGLAKVHSSSGETLGLTQSGMAMGTLHYMAPEALMLGTAVDHRADIYAVGVMLYQMLTGKLPHGMFKMPSLQVPGLDPRYDAIIAKAMMEEREARYQQIGEMRVSLDSILTQPVVKVEPATPDAPAQAAMLPTNARPQRPGGRQPARLYSDPEPPRGSLAWLWVTVLVLTVLGGVGWLMFDTPKQPVTKTASPPATSTPQSSVVTEKTAPTTPPATIPPATVSPAPPLDEKLILGKWTRTNMDQPGPAFEMELRPSGEAAWWGDGSEVDGTWKQTGAATVKLTWRSGWTYDLTLSPTNRSLLTGEASGPDGKLVALRFEKGVASAPAAPASLTETFNGHRYQFVPGSFTWLEAKVKAESMGGHLATLTSKEENEWLLETFKSQLSSEANPLKTSMIWLGGIEEKPGTGWKWVTGEPFQFTAWMPGEPNGEKGGRGQIGHPFMLNFYSGGTEIGWNDNSADPVLASKMRGFIVEWDAETPPAMAASAEEGFVPMFPNNALAGWKGDVAGYRLANGMLTSTINGGDLISPKEYGNFHLKFDLRLSSGANNGIGVWCADNNQGYKYVAHTGFEIQLIDDNLPSFSKGQPWHLHGALSYFLAPRAKPMGPVGSWNTHEIRMEGTRLTVSINNVTVIDQELPTGDPVAEGSRRHRLDLSKKRGHLVFCGMKGPVDFRNVMIKDLDASRAVAPPIPSPPAVVTSATTWIDSTGRSIQAKFVRIEGANVILEIGGNQTRVPLARLSPASQDQARQFATLPQSSATPKVRTVTTSSTANDPGNDGFISLLDANQPGDWLQAGPGRMDIKNGVSTNSSPTKWGVAIYTKQKFSDFILKAEFKGMGSKFNSGLWLRIADYRSDFLSIHASKYEVGIRYSSGELRTTTGAIWGVQPARVDALKANDWNELEVTVTGQRYVVKLNGQLVNDFTGNKGLSGYIGLEENFEGPVQFRNVRVKPLP